MHKKQDDIIEPIDANFEEVTEIISKDLGTTHKYLKNTGLNELKSELGTALIQEELSPVERQIEYQEIEMGVLENGVPYLTGRGLERMNGSMLPN